MAQQCDRRQDAGFLDWHADMLTVADLLTLATGIALAGGTRLRALLAHVRRAEG